MQPWQAILLGIVQGLTEFLPVSSSGHLVLLEQLLVDINAMQPLVFELVLHAGTLLAIFLVYRYDILDIAVFPFRHGWKRGADELSLWQKWRTTEAGWLIVLTVAASVPTAVIGLLFETTFERLFSNPLATGIALLVTGGLLMASRLRAAGNGGILDIPLWVAFVIGLVQGLSITPGISRSGSTIAIALLLGVGRESAGKLSFLISIPAIVGALVFKLGGDFHYEPIRDFIPLFLGFLFSFAIGYLALQLLLGFIKQGRLHWWSWYCWAAGLAAIIWFGPLGH